MVRDSSPAPVWPDPAPPEAEPRLSARAAAHLGARYLAGLNPETTLFITASKSFATQETLTNSQRARRWLAAAAGTRAKMTLTDAVVTYSEPGAFAPTLKADRLFYEPGKRITGENGRLGLGDFHLFTLPKFDRPVEDSIIGHLTARVGYRHYLGAYLDLGLQVPVWPGINLGGDFAEYTARGPMAGPSGTYRLTPDGGDITGSFQSGFLDDHGDRGIDLLGRPVPAKRGFFEWSHQQTIGDRVTVTGEFNWCSR